MKTSRERQTKNAHFKISMSEKYSLMRYKPDLKYVIKADKQLLWIRILYFHFVY